MKTKLGLIAAAAIFGPWPAMADTYTYDVSFNIGSTLSITGTIVTNCDNCALSNSPPNVVSWSFTGSDGNSFSSTDPGAQLAMGTVPAALVASPTAIDLPYGPGGPFGAFEFCIDCSSGTTDELDFIYTANESIVEWGAGDPRVDTQINTDAVFQVATLSSSTSTTPLPTALPLFATGLGMIGLLARRTKRKAPAIAIT